MENLVNDNQLDQIEQMRQEIAVLREKLDRQTIISEEHVRRCMKNTVSRFRTRTIVLSVITLAGMVYCFVCMYKWLGFTLALSLFTVLFLMSAVIVNGWMVFRLNPSDMMGNNLASASREIIRIKKTRKMWKKIAFPVVVVWYVWVVVEALKSGLGTYMLSGFLTGCSVGLLGGLIIGLIYDRRQIAEMDGLLKQIDDLTAGE